MAGKQGELPPGYTRLEYLHLDYGERIVCDIPSTSTWKVLSIHCKFRVISCANYASPYSNRSGNLRQNDIRYIEARNTAFSSLRISSSWGDYTAYTGLALNTIYTVEHMRNSCQIFLESGELKATVSLNAPLYNITSNYIIGSSIYDISEDIYEYNDGNVNDLIPCLNPEGQKGMYNKKGRNFIPVTKK